MSGNAPFPQPGVPFPGRADREARSTVAMPPTPAGNSLRPAPMTTGPAVPPQGPAPRRAAVPPSRTPSVAPRIQPGSPVAAQAAPRGPIPSSAPPAVPPPPAASTAYGAEGRRATGADQWTIAGRGPGGDPPERERLGAGWIAFIVAYALLVIGAVALAISLFGGGQPQTAQGTTPPPVASPSPSDSPTPAAVTQSFASPSGNIVCDMSEQAVTCSIATLAQAPAPVEGCDGTVGHRVVLEAGGVQTPCVPVGEQPRPAGGDAPVLDYGQAKTVGRYTCESSQAGVTCRDDAGQGFTLAKSGIQEL